jgi:hypothetical protein
VSSRALRIEAWRGLDATYLARAKEGHFEVRLPPALWDLAWRIQHVSGGSSPIGSCEVRGMMCFTQANFEDAPYGTMPDDVRDFLRSFRRLPKL